MWTSMLWVAIGGAVGSVGRYLVGELARKLTPHAGAPDMADRLVYPVGTLAVNVLGCLAIGFLLALTAGRRELLSDELRLCLVVGLLGGFTTFSAFGYDTVVLAQGGRLSLAALNVAANMVLGLAAVWLGMVLARPLVPGTE